MPTGERCLEREELERVVGAYIESIFRTSLAIERTPQMKGWSKGWTFTATKNAEPWKSFLPIANCTAAR